MVVVGPLYRLMIAYADALLGATTRCHKHEELAKHGFEPWTVIGEVHGDAKWWKLRIV